MERELDDGLAAAGEKATPKMGPEWPTRRRELEGLVLGSLVVLASFGIGFPSSDQTRT